MSSLARRARLRRIRRGFRPTILALEERQLLADGHFVTSDSMTQGSWKEVYGQDGFALAGDPSGNNPTTPAYLTGFDVSGAVVHAWTDSTSDVRAPQKAAAGSTDRLVSAWYSPTSFSIDLDLTDGRAHRLALYALDYDGYGGGRSERIDVLDAASGAVLSTQAVDSFQNGVYLVWNATGHVTVQVTNTNPGSNALLNGLFLDSPTPTPTPPAGLAATAVSASEIALSWSDGADEDGYRIERSPDGTSGWTEVGTVGADVTSFADTGLAASTTYFYRARASNAAGDSAPSGVASATTVLFSDSFGGASLGPAWQTVGGNWAQHDGVLGQTARTPDEPQKAMIIDLAFPTDVRIRARVRVDSWLGGDGARAGVSLAQGAGGLGYNLLFVDGGVKFLDDHVVWSDLYSFSWQVGTWYWFALESQGGVLSGKVWQDGTAEPASFAFVQAGWTTRGAGAAGLNGGSGASTASFDDVTVASAGAVTVPPAPTNLAASAASAGQIDLSWSGVSSADVSKIERSPDGTTGWTQVGTAAAGTTTFADTGLAASTTYFYRARASNAAGDSAPSGVVSATTRATGGVLFSDSFGGASLGPAWQTVGGNWAQHDGVLGQTARTPDEPQKAMIIDLAFPTDVRIRARVRVDSWLGGDGARAGVSLAQGAGGLGYNLLFVDGGVKFLDDHVVWSDLYSFSWQVGTWYWFALESQGGVLSGKVWQDGTAEPASFAFVQAGWTTRGAGAAGLNGGSGASTASFDDVTVASAGAVTTPTPTPPAGLAATAVSPSEIALSWSDVADEDGYRIERSPDGISGWTEVKTTASEVTSTADLGLSDGTRYYYRVSAFNGGGISGYSGTANAVTSAAAPANLSAMDITANQIDLAWTDRSSSEWYYALERSTDGSSGWQQIGTTTANTTSFAAPGPFDGATGYDFRVRAYGPGGYSAYSSIASVTTPAFPIAPALISAVTQSDTAIAVTWSNVTNEEGYRVERSQNGDGTWADAGSVAANVTSFTDTGLQEAKSYSYRVMALNSLGDSAPSATRVAFTHPSAPDGLTATAVSATGVELTWNDRSSSETYYHIEQSPSGTTGWQQVGTAAANSTNFRAPGPFNSAIIYFRVRAYRPSAGYSSYSPAFPVIIPLGLTTPPITSAVAQSDTVVSVTWLDVDNEDGYRVERSLNGGVTWELAGSVPAGATSFTDTGRHEATMYTYRILASNAAGNSAPSATRVATTPPIAPANLAAAALSGSRIDLTWIDRSSAETYYFIEQSPDGTSGWQQVGTTLANATSFVVAGPFNGATPYTFRVRAFSYIPSVLYSAYSPVASVTTPAFPNVPVLTSGVAQSDTAVALAWTDVAGEDGYRVERSLNGGTWTVAGSTAANATNFTDTGLQEAKSYSYRVLALNAAGDSAPSATSAATTMLAAPDGFSATIISAARIDLAWSDRSSAETYYFIEQSPAGTGGWQQVGTTLANATSFVVAGPFNGATPYSFRVRAYRVLPSSIFSMYSPVASVTMPAFPNAPVLTSAVAQSDTTIALAWTDVAGEDGYRVERSLNGGATWADAGSVAANVTSFTDTGRQEAKSYSYRVLAFNSLGDSAPSATRVFDMPPTPPDGLTATFVSPARIDLTWNDRSSAETYYFIEQSPDGTGGWQQVGTAGANATNYIVPGSFNGATPYSFRIRAFGYIPGVIYSAYSPVASVTTPAFPNAPANLGTTAISPTQIDLSWSDVTGETGYLIEHSTNVVGGWTQVGTTGADITTYSDIGLTEGTNYYYRVRSSSDAGPSNYSGIGSRTSLHYTPTVTLPASAMPGTVTSTTTNLSVLGDVPGEESKLRYTWSVSSKPPAAPTPTFSLNGLNAAKNTSVTFSMAGSYTLRATITNGTASITSDISVAVSPQLTSITISPASPVVKPGTTLQFTANAKDQFGRPMPNPSPVAWSLPGGTPGTIDTNGLFTAPDDADDDLPMTVDVTADGVSASSQFRVEVSNRVTIDFEDLPVGTIVTDQYPFAIFSADPGKTNVIHAHRVVGTWPLNPDPQRFNNNMYVDFITPVDDLKLASYWDDESGTIGQVKVITADGTTSTVNLQGDADPYTKNLIDLSQYHKVKRLELSIIDIYGLGWDDFSFIAAGPDLDIDSSNEYGYDPEFPRRYLDGPEDENENQDDTTGKILAVNNGDTNGDGVPDFAEGFGPDGEPNHSTPDVRFVPVVFEIPKGVDLSKARIKFDYSGSDPAGVTVTTSDTGPVYTPANGRLRLWTKNGGEDRNESSVADGGDYIAPGEALSPSDLGMDDDHRTITLWLEAVSPRPEIDMDHAADKIKVSLDLDGDGSAGFSTSDTIRVTVSKAIVVFLNLGEDHPPTDPSNPRGLNPEYLAVFNQSRNAWLTNIGTPMVPADATGYDDLASYTSAAEAQSQVVRTKSLQLAAIANDPSAPKADYLNALEDATYAYDVYLHAYQEAVRVQAQFLKHQWYLSSSDRVLLDRVADLPTRIDGIDAGLTPDQWSGLRAAHQQVGESLGDMIDHLDYVEGAMQGALNGLIIGGAFIGGAIFSAPLALGVGSMLLGAGIGTAAGTRWNDGQSAAEIVVGTATDVSGFNSLYVGITGTDAVTGQVIALTPNQQGQRFGLGLSALSLTIAAGSASTGQTSSRTTINLPNPASWMRAGSATGSPILYTPGMGAIPLTVPSYIPVGIPVPAAHVNVATTSLGATQIVLYMTATGEPDDVTELPDPLPNQLSDRLQHELDLADQLGVNPAAPGTPQFDQAINSGTVKWAITEDGQLLVIPKWANGQEISHSVITRGAQVLAAGEADIAGNSGNYIGIDVNNNSGHYIPTLRHFAYARLIFERLGITFSNWEGL